MKEDILEQIAEDFFVSQPGFFVKSNIKYRPDKSIKDYDAKYDSVHSDVDVVAINKATPNEIYVINCKSWQGGLDLPTLESIILNAIETRVEKSVGKRESWMSFRELCSVKWSKAFVKKLRSELGIERGDKFKINYTILFTRLVEKKNEDRLEQDIISNLGNKIKEFFKTQVDKKVKMNFEVKTLNDYLKAVLKRIQDKDTPAVENSHLGRTIQLIWASGNTIVDIKTHLKSFPLNCTECGTAIGTNKVWVCEKHCFETLQFICEKCHHKKTNKTCNICDSKLKSVERKKITIDNSLN